MEAQSRLSGITQLGVVNCNDKLESGKTLMQRLRLRNYPTPVAFVTGNGKRPQQVPHRLFKSTDDLVQCVVVSLSPPPAFPIRTHRIMMRWVLVVPPMHVAHAPQCSRLCGVVVLCCVVLCCVVLCCVVLCCVPIPIIDVCSALNRWTTKVTKPRLLRIRTSAQLQSCQRRRGCVVVFSPDQQRLDPATRHTLRQLTHKHRTVQFAFLDTSRHAVTAPNPEVLDALAPGLGATVPSPAPNRNKRRVAAPHAVLRGALVVRRLPAPDTSKDNAASKEASRSSSSSSSGGTTTTTTTKKKRNSNSNKQNKPSSALAYEARWVEDLGDIASALAPTSVSPGWGVPLDQLLGVEVLDVDDEDEDDGEDGGDRSRATSGRSKNSRGRKNRKGKPDKQQKDKKRTGGNKARKRKQKKQRKQTKKTQQDAPDHGDEGTAAPAQDARERRRAERRSMRQQRRRQHQRQQRERQQRSSSNGSSSSSSSSSSSGGSSNVNGDSADDTRRATSLPAQAQAQAQTDQSGNYDDAVSSREARAAAERRRREEMDAEAAAYVPLAADDVSDEWEDDEDEGDGMLWDGEFDEEIEL